MVLSLRSLLSLICLILLPLSTSAEQIAFQDIHPARPKRKAGEEDHKRREALKLYAKAASLEKKHRLVEATKTFEQALTIDKDSIAIRKALIPLYISLDRRGDAMKKCREVLDLNEDQYEVWYRYAQQLYLAEKSAEAIQALEKGVSCKGLQTEPPAKKIALLDELGLLYEEAKEYLKAEKAFREVAMLLDKKRNPAKSPISEREAKQQWIETWQRIGDLALKNDAPARALTAFQKAREKDKSLSLRFYLDVARVYSAQKKTREALKWLDQYLALQPSEMTGYELKIQILRDAGQSRLIVPMLVQHAKADRHNNALQLVLARELTNAGSLAAAETVFKRLTQGSPSMKVFQELIKLRKKEGESGLAKILSHLNEAVIASTKKEEGPPGFRPKQNKANANYLLSALRKDRELVSRLLPIAHRKFLQSPQFRFKTRAILASLAWRTNQLHISEALFRSCIDRNGKVRRDVTIRSYAEFEQGVYQELLSVLRRRRKYPEVLVLCDQGIKHSQITNQVVFYLGKSQAYVELDKPKEAIQAADKAIDLSSDLNRLLCLRRKALILSQLNRHKEAIKLGTSLLKDFTEKKDVQRIRYTLSGIYSAANKKQKSAEQLQAILELDPSDATACNDLGYLWADQNRNLDEAEKLIRKALELDRFQRTAGGSVDIDTDLENAAYVDSLGWVLFRKGQFQKAKEQLEKAVVLPDGEHDPVLHDHLGDVYFRLKQNDKAIHHWKQALKLYKDRWRRDREGRVKDIQEKLKLVPK